MDNEIHVVPEAEDTWVVEEGQSGIGSMHETKEEALEEARELAVSEDVPLVIHGAGGEIRDREDPELLKAQVEREPSG